MIWIIDKYRQESYQIIGTNIYEKDGNDVVYELWATKPSGKTIKLIDSTDRVEIQDYKEAIDYAISSREPVFTVE